MALHAAHDQYMTFSGLNLTNSLASEVRQAFAGAEIDVTTLGSSWGQFRQGQAGITFTVNGVWDDGTAATNLDAVLYTAQNGGGTKLYEYMPAGSASDKIKYVGNAVLTAYEIGGAVGDKVGFSVTLKGADAPTRSIQA